MSAQCPNSKPKTKPQPSLHGDPSKVARRPFRWAGKGRSREGETYRAVVRALTKQLGGEASAAQALLIGQAAWMSVHLAKLNASALNGDGLTETRLSQFMDLHRLYARCLRDIGLKELPPEQESWGDVLARLSARGTTDAGDDQ
jgi:hypothetical protein